ncbi:MAG: glycosyltransferase [Candidatus Eremiobacteraeota bacterium]|nr:glycosyltransferase [Candidatus Eremiobacteraeota bacterium]MBC5802150.1 glycosyltransferase [Candidatus Eremiobacteraeota bacterium]
MRVHNAGRFVGAAIESVLAQSFKDFELLVIDDGSTDDSPAVITAFTDRRIQYVQLDRCGLARATNIALQRARGDYIAIMDADDLAYEDRLAKQVAVLDQEMRTVLVGSWIDVIDEHGQSRGERRYPTGDGAIRKALLRANPFAHPTLMYRRTAARDAGGYRDVLPTVEDYDFNLRLLRNGEGRNVPHKLLAYRTHAHSVKATKTKQQLRETIRLRGIAHRTYGYRFDTTARSIDTAQRCMMALPSSSIRWLFERVSYQKA